MACILIVDDEPLNRELLKACFQGAGHELVEAGGGVEALELADTCAPDLVLLDVMMPDLDGFEVTRQLKARFDDEFLPIILVTALGARDARLTGLAAGADEFLSKPVDREELLMRAGNLLRLRAHELELTRRTVELAEVQRSRDELMAMLVHDLKSPLAVILGSVEFALGEPDLTPALQGLLDDVQQAAGRIGRMVSGLMDTALAEGGKLVIRRDPVRLDRLVEGVLAPRRGALVRRKVAVEVELGEAVAVSADRDMLTRVVENLVDASGRVVPNGGRLRVWAEAAGDLVALRVGCTAPALPPGRKELAFEKFTRVWGHTRAATGLGLYFCRLAVEAHGGAIALDDAPDLPNVFTVRLPPAVAG